VLKTLLWEKAKVHGISPIQIRILLFVSTHSSELCNVSALAREFQLTKPTISDAVRVLLKKEYLKKDLSPADNRRFNLQLTDNGKKLVQELSDYASPVSEEIDSLSSAEQQQLFASITALIFRLNQKGIIEVQRNCFGCRFYQGNRTDQHHCGLLKQNLLSEEIRLDCPEYEPQQL